MVDDPLQRNEKVFNSANFICTFRFGVSTFVSTRPNFGISFAGVSVHMVIGDLR